MKQHIFTAENRTNLTSTMQKSHHLEAKNLRFSVFSSKNIKSLSVAKVITPMLFDPLGHALPGGLYDPKMGKKFDEFLLCETCE